MHATPRARLPYACAWRTRILRARVGLQCGKGRGKIGTPDIANASRSSRLCWLTVRTLIRVIQARSLFLSMPFSARSGPVQTQDPEPFPLPTCASPRSWRIAVPLASLSGVSLSLLGVSRRLHVVVFNELAVSIRARRGGCRTALRCSYWRSTGWTPTRWSTSISSRCGL